MKIGELASKTQVSVQAIRLYHRLGLIPAVARRSSGYREFQEGAVSRIRFIRDAQALGFSLEEIRELIRDTTLPREGKCSRIARSIHTKRAEIAARIEGLKRLEAGLKRLARSCHVSKRSSAECSIEGCFSKGECI